MGFLEFWFCFFECFYFSVFLGFCFYVDFFLFGMLKLKRVWFIGWWGGYEKRRDSKGKGVEGVKEGGEEGWGRGLGKRGIVREGE